jgi:hypothetical protein
MFQFSLVIKQIITKYMIIFFKSKTNGQTQLEKSDDNNLEMEAVFFEGFFNENKCSLLLIDP